MTKLLIFTLDEMARSLEAERDQADKRQEELRVQEPDNDRHAQRSHGYEEGSAAMQSAFAGGMARKLRQLVEALREEAR